MTIERHNFIENGITFRSLSQFLALQKHCQLVLCRYFCFLVNHINVKITTHLHRPSYSKLFSFIHYEFSLLCENNRRSRNIFYLTKIKQLPKLHNLFTPHFSPHSPLNCNSKHSTYYLCKNYVFLSNIVVN